MKKPIRLCLILAVPVCIQARCIDCPVVQHWFHLLTTLSTTLSSAFDLVTVSVRAPYAAVDVRRPSFPSCRLASLEQSATSRHVRTVTACFLQSSEDSSLQSQFSLTILSCLRSDTRHYGHINRCSYLLTIGKMPTDIPGAASFP